jgi:tRNA pseudouridine55 synthase
MSSFDVIRRLRGRFARLDPFAEGVLVVCVGPATRLAEYVQAQSKQYDARIALGAGSTTDDPEGQITPTAGAATPDDPDVREVVAGFVGEVEQVPPAHSAVHVDGRRAYKLAPCWTMPKCLRIYCRKPG